MNQVNLDRPDIKNQLNTGLLLEHLANKLSPRIYLYDTHILKSGLESKHYIHILQLVDFSGIELS